MNQIDYIRNEINIHNALNNLNTAFYELTITVYQTISELINDQNKCDKLKELGAIIEKVDDTTFDLNTIDNSGKFRFSINNNIVDCIQFIDDKEVNLIIADSSIMLITFLRIVNYISQE